MGVKTISLTIIFYFLKLKDNSALFGKIQNFEIFYSKGIYQQKPEN